MKPDEKALAKAVLARADYCFVDVLGETLGIHRKRTLGILTKWSRRDWWDYGVSLRSGWLTDTGKQELEGVTR